MKNLTLITVLLATLVIGGTGTISARTQTDIVVSAEGPEQHAMATWAISRYELAGLTLPPLDIVFAGPDEAPCGGNPARTTFDGTPTITMCWDNEFMLLHELGHVWVSANVPQAVRREFMALRNVTEWAGADVPWAQRGGEHAANVVAWGLLEKPYPVSRTYPNDSASLRFAYALLTGVEPLHDGGPDLPVARPTGASSLSGPTRGSGR